MEIEAPQNLKRPLFVPNKTLMGPGPTNASQRVLTSLGNPLLGHMHSECFQIMDDIKDGIKYLFQTKNKFTLCISGSAHAAMETALCNLIEKDDIVLVGITGIWGQRVKDMAQRYGAKVCTIQCIQWGYQLEVDKIYSALEQYKPKIFYLVQGESSTGVLQNHLKEIGEYCRSFECLFVVDCVASLCSTAFFMDKWFIDVALTGSQKCLGAAPGISPISFSDRAIKVFQQRRTPVTVYYFDLQPLGQYWNCWTNKSDRIYHHTISTTLLYGLREALAQVCTQGLENIILRHQKSSERLQKSLQDLGFKLFVKNSFCRLPTITTILIPNEIGAWRAVCEYAMKKYSMEIGGGLGPTANKVFRIGLMGENATTERVDLVVNILNEALECTKLSRKLSKI